MDVWYGEGARFTRRPMHALFLHGRGFANLESPPALHRFGWRRHCDLEHSSKRDTGVDVESIRERLFCAWHTAAQDFAAIDAGNPAAGP